MLTIMPLGGTRFHASCDGEHLGVFYFGSLDKDGQYVESDNEIMSEARENFGFEPDYPAEVK